MSERERFFISWRYYLDAAQAWDQALDLALSWTTTYPREAFAFNSLGLASGAFGQHDQAVDAFREAIRLDPRFVPPYGNLAGSLIALESVRGGEVAARGSGDPWDRLHQPPADRVHAGVSRRRSAAPWRASSSLLAETPEAMWAANWEARTSAFAGRVQRRARVFTRRAFRRRFATTSRELAAQWTMEDAEVHAIAGQCGDARREVVAWPRARPRQLHAGASQPDAGAMWRRRRSLQGLTDDLARSFSSRDADHAASAAGHRGRAGRRATRTRARASNCWIRSSRTITRRRRSSGRSTCAVRRSSSANDGAAPATSFSASWTIAARRRPRRCTRSRISGWPAPPLWRATTPRPARPTTTFFALWKGADPDLTAADRSSPRNTPASSSKLVRLHQCLSLHQRAKDVFLAALEQPGQTARPSWRRRAATTRRCARKSSRCSQFHAGRRRAGRLAKAPPVPTRCSRPARCSPAATG